MALYAFRKNLHVLRMNLPALPKVLNTVRCLPGEMAPLEGLAELIEGPGDDSTLRREEVLERAPELVGIINQGELKVDAELLARAPQLKVVANVALGYDNLDVSLMTRQSVWAVNAPDFFYIETAEFTIGAMIALTRRIHDAHAHVRAGHWKRHEPWHWDGITLAGKTLGIVGYGRIGKAVARMARGLNMNILFHRRTPSDDPGYRSLEALLSESDVVSVHTPANADSIGLFNRERFAQMKPGAYLINVARGSVMVEADLAEALSSGHLAGAALDVFEKEPEVHPTLLTLPNVLLTPHLGGCGTENRARARFHCAQNVAAVLRGERPPAALNDPGVGPSAADDPTRDIPIEKLRTWVEEDENAMKRKGK